jgi:hypothetical protein
MTSDESRDAPWDGVSSLPQTFDAALGPAVMLEGMIPFYEAFIPLNPHRRRVIRRHERVMVSDIMRGAKRRTSRGDKTTARNIKSEEWLVHIEVVLRQDYPRNHDR